MFCGWQVISSSVRSSQSNNQTWGQFNTIKMRFLLLFPFHVLFFITINPKVRLFVAGSFAEISARLLLRAQ